MAKTHTTTAIAELDGAGNLVSRFVYGARAVAPEYLIRGGVSYRIVTDHLGSVRLVVNTSTGAITQASIPTRSVSTSWSNTRRRMPSAERR